MLRPFFVALFSAGLLTSLTVNVHAQEREALKTFMRAKLGHSQKVLEGLVQDDFAKVEKNAQELSLLSLAATWQVLTTPEYVELSRKFRTEADKLTEAAKQKNLDQAAKAFNGVTRQCVECHKYLRDVKFASLNR